MNHLFRTILLLLSIVATVYFAILWIGTARGEDYIFRPSWIKPNTEEPFTIFCGIFSALIGVWERLSEYFAKFGGVRLTIVNSCMSLSVNRRIIGNLKATFRTIQVSLFIQNQSNEQLVIKSIKVFSVNAQKEIGDLLTISNEIASMADLIPKNDSRRLSMEFLNERIPVHTGDQLNLEVTFSNGNRITKGFNLGQ